MKRKNTNSYVKQGMPYLILFLVIVGVMSFFELSQYKVNEFSYDKFVNELDGGNVNKLEITAKNGAGIYYITGTLDSYSSKESFKVNVPLSETVLSKVMEYVEDDNNLEKREIYWIKELGTYGKGGYNATIGGDGKLLYDHNEIIELYRMGYNTSQISQKLNCDTTTITSVLRANGIKSRGRSKMVDQFDLAGNFI